MLPRLLGIARRDLRGLKKNDLVAVCLLEELGRQMYNKLGHLPGDKLPPLMSGIHFNKIGGKTSYTPKNMPMSFRVWQLLAEIKIPAKSIDLEEGQRSARLVVEAVQPLDIAPEVLNRISQSIFVALKNAVWKLKPSRESTGAAILIYCPVGNSPDEPDVPLGWGFFMVERLENSLEAGSERARYAIELFLYPSL